jgi:hypothetical protein
MFTASPRQPLVGLLTEFCFFCREVVMTETTNDDRRHIVELVRNVTVQL